MNIGITGLIAAAGLGIAGLIGSAGSGAPTTEQLACFANAATGIALETEIAKPDANPLAIALIPQMLPGAIMEELTEDGFDWDTYVEEVRVYDFMNDQQLDNILALCGI